MNSLWKQVLASLGLALGLSIDSGLVGVVYAARKVSIPPLSLTLVSLATGILMLVSMTAGEIVSLLVPPGLAHILGGTIILLMGLWQFWRGCVEKPQRIWTLPCPNTYASGTQDDPVTHVDLVKQIVRAPVLADQDDSGVIDVRESVLLGLALGIDALTAGFGASLTDFWWMVIPVVSVCSPLFLLLGSCLGNLLNLDRLVPRSGILTGTTLMIVGLLKIKGCL